jgi:ATP-dependent 26S proteasome regulatory subunit
MFAIRDDRDHIVQDDLNKAVRKLQEAKKQCVYAPLPKLTRMRTD